MHHIPTRATFEIVYDADHDVLGGLTIFGFAARLYDLGDGGQPPDNADELAAIGHEAIVAFLCDECLWRTGNFRGRRKARYTFSATHTPRVLPLLFKSNGANYM